MNSPDAWPRLAAAARRAPDDRSTAAPYGFAVRVAALGLDARPERISFLAQFSLGLSLRACALACLLAVGLAGFSYSDLVKAYSEDTPRPLTVKVPQLAPHAPKSVRTAPLVGEVPAAPAMTPTSDDPVADLVNIVS